jgi:hypothetical protein
MIGPRRDRRRASISFLDIESGVSILAEAEDAKRSNAGEQLAKE